MNIFTTACVAGALTIAAALPANAFQFAMYEANFATELAPEQICSVSQAMGIVVDHEVKPVVTLPLRNGVHRFVGVSYATGRYVGASVTANGCNFNLVADVGMQRPYCEYLPRPSERCPTTFLAN